MVKEDDYIILWINHGNSIWFYYKREVLRYDKQIGALRLQDMTIVKFMLSHIAVAMVGVYFLYDLGIVKLSIKSTILGGVVIGAIIFGIGWGLLGYCPGTSLGALGEGRIDALWGIGGMLVGAGVYAEAYPYLQKQYLLGEIMVKLQFRRF